MAAYTEHYHLHQWEPEDNFLRTDFNEDFQKIDSALAAIPVVITGSYMGTGAAEVIHYHLGQRPKLLILSTKNNFSGNTHDCFLVAVEGIMINFNSAGGQSARYNAWLTFDDNGFSIDHSQNDIVLGYNRECYEQVYWALC